MGDSIFAGIAAVVMFVLGMIAKSKIEKRREVRERAEQAKRRERVRAKHAKRTFDRSLEKARRQAEEEVRNRDYPDDPVAGLAERIRRRAKRKRAAGQRDRERAAGQRDRSNKPDRAG